MQITIWTRDRDILSDDSFVERIDALLAERRKSTGEHYGMEHVSDDGTRIVNVASTDDF